MAVDAGAGDDVVDGTSSTDAVAADLGTGADTFIGSDLGSGTDDLVTVAPDSSAPDVLQAGGGTDGLVLDSGAADLVVDNVAGTARVGGRVVATWTGIEQFRLTRTGARTLTFVGSWVSETVVDGGTGSGVLDVDLGGGRDSFATSAPPAVGSRIAAGGGDDRLEIAAAGTDLDLDLQSGVLEVGRRATHEVAVPDFEDVALTARRAVVDGDRGPNDLAVTACSAVVRGHGSGDRIDTRYSAPSTQASTAVGPRGWSVARAATRSSAPADPTGCPADRVATSCAGAAGRPAQRRRRVRLHARSVRA